MRIVIAPDPVKQGFQQVMPNAQFVFVPVADGGEGTVQSLVNATEGSLVHADVTVPLGEEVSAFEEFRQ